MLSPFDGQSMEICISTSHDYDYNEDDYLKCNCIQCFLCFKNHSFFLFRFGAELTYYGISLNIDSFGLNLYLTQFIFASMEVPMKISVFFFLNKLGRNPSEMGALFLTAIFLVINIFVSTGLC